MSVMSETPRMVLPFGKERRENQLTLATGNGFDYKH